MQPPRDFLGEKIWKRAGLADMAIDPESSDARAFRLACLQEARMPGQTQTAFAAYVGLDVVGCDNLPHNFQISLKIVVALPNFLE